MLHILIAFILYMLIMSALYSMICGSDKDRGSRNSRHRNSQNYSDYDYDEFYAFNFVDESADGGDYGGDGGE
ncbi:MAG: hypothetical protein PUD55_00445 [Firmicutes bacterium]|nr:hypothetical protein [Bacillota bacterium]